ncbi:MAG: hypothetical protein ACREE6_15120 [Limisphaerales bacterium]
MSTTKVSISGSNRREAKCGGSDTALEAGEALSLDMAPLPERRPSKPSGDATALHGERAESNVRTFPALDARLGWQCVYC